jgi:hypothetical protein
MTLPLFITHISIALKIAIIQRAALAVYLYSARCRRALIRVVIYTIPIAVCRSGWLTVPSDNLCLLFPAKGKAESCGIKEIVAR